MRFCCRTFCFVLCLILLLPLIPQRQIYAYSGGYTIIGDVSIPFTEYMPGTFFTKNGYECTCHADSSVDCIASGSRCNCLRYTEIDGKAVDLLAVQCIGFARYCFYRLFGFIDQEQLNGDLFYSAGSIAYGSVTESSVKALFAKLKPGAHIRFKLSATQHSVILLSQSESGFTVYQCNSGGDGIAQADCVISTKTYTWASFASYAYRGIVFANMPYNYPERLEYSDKPVVTEGYGIYTTTDNLKLRDAAGTSGAWIDTVPKGTQLFISELVGNWGRTVYNGKHGFVSLNYLAYTRKAPNVSVADERITVKNGCIIGVRAGTTAEELIGLLTPTGAKAGIDGSEAVCTGTLITVTDSGGALCTYTAVVVGDLNGDGAVSTADCAVIKQLLTGDEADAHVCFAADINGDGMINTTDYKNLKLNLLRRDNDV